MVDYRYRVFVSYSHKDKPFAAATADVLDDIGLEALWDQNLSPSASFTEDIQQRIARAHIFVPLITPGALKAGWVHQEIGFALSSNVPVLPVTKGADPGQMIQGVQAIKVADDFSNLRQQMGTQAWDLIVGGARKAGKAVYQMVMHHDQRSELLADAADSVEKAMATTGKRERYVRVRQAAALSSFNIPDLPTTNRVWREREGDVPRNTHSRDLSRRERQKVQEHATTAGCDLIIAPQMSRHSFRDVSRRARLTTLRHFLADASDDKLRVAVCERTDENILILGDWFVARAVAGSPRTSYGYRQTIASWHAPTVLELTRQFDNEMEALLGDQAAEQGERSSRQYAVDTVDALIAEIKTP